MKQQPQFVLSPVQLRALEGLRQGSARAQVVLLRARTGSGRSTILRRLGESLGGALVSVRHFVGETFLARIERALAQHDTVIVDDLHLLTAEDEPRAFLIDASLTAIVGEALVSRKKLIFGSGEISPWPLARRAVSWELADFGAEDYACICRNVLPQQSRRLDYVRIHAAVPGLSAKQLRRACTQLNAAGKLDTVSMIEHFRR